MEVRKGKGISLKSYNKLQVVLRVNIKILVSSPRPFLYLQTQGHTEQGSDYKQITSFLEASLSQYPACWEISSYSSLTIGKKGNPTCNTRISEKVK